MSNIQKSKASHGGKRIGAGRKPSGERSARVSIPESAKEIVVDLVQHLADLKATQSKWPSHLKPVALAENPPKFKIPMFAHTVQAGFPSPADDYIADTLDLNEHLIHHKEATFFVEASGASMIGAGIHDGDILVVDKSITATNGDVIIATVDGEFTVKKLDKSDGKVRLMPENPDFKPIEFKNEQELLVFGVVTSVIHQFKR